SNVPTIEGEVWLFPDVSGSMTTPVTGYHGKRASTVTCREVAALCCASLAGANPKTVNITPFSDRVVPFHEFSTYMDLYHQLCKLPSGGTDCAAPMSNLVKLTLDGHAKPDVVIYFSDNESWIDERVDHDARLISVFGNRLATTTALAFERLKKLRPEVKLVCVDLAPNQGRQVKDNKNVLNIGGFSDTVFELIALFAKDQLDGAHWKGEIEKV